MTSVVGESRHYHLSALAGERVVIFCLPRNPICSQCYSFSVLLLLVLKGLLLIITGALTVISPMDTTLASQALPSPLEWKIHEN